MESGDASSFESSHILLITQKGMEYFRRSRLLAAGFELTSQCRVLMATIKARGDCPCVLCLVKKKNLNQMGTTEDMIFRDQHPRIDDDARRKSVLESREIIRGGIAVGGDRVVACLSNSDVPTVVSVSFYSIQICL